MTWQRTAWPVLQQRSSQSAQTSIEKRLTKGRRALRAIRWRVSGGMLTLGFSGAMFYLVQFATLDCLWLDAVSWALQAISILLLNLAPLPDDKRLTQVVLALTAALMAATVLTDMQVDPDKPYLRSFCESAWGCRAVKIYSPFTRIMDVLGLLAIVGTISFMSPSKAQAVSWVGIAVLFSCSLIWDLIFAVILWAERRGTALSWYYLLGDVLGIFVASSPALREAIQQRLRQLFQRHQAAAAAAGLASLVGNCPTVQVLDEAKERFRSVRLADIVMEDVANNSPDPCLFKRSQHTRLRRCDAFISHSWHDDSAMKWNALQGWRAAFVAEHCMEPAIWFDKCCIDQNNIELDLRCLPIFLAGCKRLVVLCGPTYLGRLWCIIEIFTFVHMGGDVADIELLFVCRDGHQEADEATIRTAFAKFDARKCDCFNLEDKEKMLTIIRTAFGRMEAFNQAVRAIMAEAGWREATCGATSPPSSLPSSSDENPSSSDDASSWCSAAGVGGERDARRGSTNAAE